MVCNGPPGHTQTVWLEFGLIEGGHAYLRFARPRKPQVCVEDKRSFGHFIQSGLPLQNQIRVEDISIVEVGDIFAPRQRDSLIEVAGHAKIARVAEVKDPPVARHIIVANLFSVVTGAVVTDNQFKIAERLPNDRIYSCGQTVAAIVSSKTNADRKTHGFSLCP